MSLIKKIIPLLASLLLLLQACTPPGAETSAVIGGVDASSTPGQPVLPPTVTPTIAWFPATATWTPFPTLEQTATAEMYPGMGTEMYRDDFSKLQLWSSATGESVGTNNIILDRNRLTLAINESPAKLSSISQATALNLRDFYAEMTISLNHCAGADSYGMLVRANGAQSAYRFLLDCTGQARAEQVSGGNVEILQKPVQSGDAPPAAPGIVKMGIWAAGAEMRLYLNGHYQFSVINSKLRQGSLGVYAGASSPFGMNVSFADLLVYGVDYVSPTPTMTPSRTPPASRTPRPSETHKKTSP